MRMQGSQSVPRRETEGKDSVSDAISEGSQAPRNYTNGGLRYPPLLQPNAHPVLALHRIGCRQSHTPAIAEGLAEP